MTTDLAIVAAGPAGLVAAVAAAEQGVKVLIFEKEKITGGTANMGMGPLGINTKIQKANFNEISVAEALKNQMEYTHYRVNGRLVQAIRLNHWLAGRHGGQVCRGFPLL